MDNSDLRRGRHPARRPTAPPHPAGDGLLTLAFDIITRDRFTGMPRCALLTRALARASGIGMVGGQMLDLAGEGRFGDRGRSMSARLRREPARCCAMAHRGRDRPVHRRYQALDDYGRALGGVPDRRRFARRRGDAAALGRQIVGRRTGQSTVTNSGSTAPSSACDLLARAGPALSAPRAVLRAASRFVAGQELERYLEEQARSGKRLLERVIALPEIAYPARCRGTSSSI